MSRTAGVDRRALVWAALAILLIAVVVGWFVLPIRGWIESLDAWIRDLGPWGIGLFVVAYILLVVALAPAEVMTIFAGLAFGFWAFPIVVVSATIGAALAFLLARYLFRKRLKRLIKKWPKFEAVDAAVTEDGWKVVVLMRLSPLIPFNLQNYVFGITGIGFAPYVAATFVGIMPGTAFYLYLGVLGRAVADSSAAGGGGPLRWVFLGIGLAATAAVAFLITWKASEGRRLRSRAELTILFFISTCFPLRERFASPAGSLRACDPLAGRDPLSVPS